jgi:anti-sigma factor RsiW
MPDPTPDPTPKAEVHAGGLWCHEVLVLLSRFVDGDVDDATKAAIVAHVTACDRCAQFGASFQRAVAAIRADAVEDAGVVDVDAVFAAGIDAPGGEG